MDGPVSGPSNGSPATTTSNSLVSTFSPAPIIDYLIEVLSITLGATKVETESPGSLFYQDRYAETIQKLSRYATEPVMALYVTKDAVIDQTPSDPASSLSNIIAGSYVYSISSELSTSTSTVATVALIKRAQPIDTNVPLHTQLQIMNLPGTVALNSGAQGSVSPFEVLHAMVHSALAPYFDAYTKGQETQSTVRTNRFADAEAKTGIPVTKKKLAELELSLLHLQQNIEIPELFLTLNPVLQSIIDEAVQKNTRPTLELIPSDLLQDSSFLNSLQSTVNTWIKSIQAITKMSRDTESGTAMQEINFWLSMELALERIEEQLRGDGVLLTLEVLKHAKRFLATVSFIADTGLKEATDRGPTPFLCLKHLLTLFRSPKI